jgi:hypothetical protein
MGHMMAGSSANAAEPVFQPLLVETPGGWLARSDPRERLCFAVPGTTAQEAAGNYMATYQRWLQVEDRPDPQGGRQLSGTRKRYAAL